MASSVLELRTAEMRSGSDDFSLQPHAKIGVCYRSRVLDVRGLRVALPDGRVLIDNIDLTIGEGEVVVLLGGSGAGKSTFARVLFERDELADAGFDVVAAQLDLDRGQLGLVPQRGALFDHLDVRGNLELALRHATPPNHDDPATWLERVGLDRSLAE